MRAAVLLVAALVAALSVVASTHKVHHCAHGLPGNHTELHQAHQADVLQYLEGLKSSDEFAKHFIQHNKRATNAHFVPTYNLPIVFHVTGTAAEVASITDDMIHEKLAELNRWLDGKNRGWETSDPQWNSVKAAGARLRFWLAQRNSVNAVITGINRVISANARACHHTAVGSGGLTTETAPLSVYESIANDIFGANFVATDFLNVVVCPQAQMGSVNGFSFRPLSTTFSYDMIGLSYDTFTDARFDDGQVIAHHTAHWFGVPHIFEGGCGPVGDGIADTPAQAKPTIVEAEVYSQTCPKQAGFPDIPGSTFQQCGNPIQVENVMDYNVAACVKFFTAGQVNVIRAHLFKPQSPRHALLRSVRHFATPDLFCEPTCGIHECGSNGCSTGVCGVCPTGSTCELVANVRRCTAPSRVNTVCAAPLPIVSGQTIVVENNNDQRIAFNLGGIGCTHDRVVPSTADGRYHWYSFRPLTAGAYHIGTTDVHTNIDTRVRLYKTNCAVGSCMASADDTPSYTNNPRASEIKGCFLAATDYHISVSVPPDQIGQFALFVKAITVSPACAGECIPSCITGAPAVPPALSNFFECGNSACDKRFPDACGKCTGGCSVAAGGLCTNIGAFAAIASAGGAAAADLVATNTGAVGASFIDNGNENPFYISKITIQAGAAGTNGAQLQLLMFAGKGWAANAVSILPGAAPQATFVPGAAMTFRIPPVLFQSKTDYTFRVQVNGFGTYSIASKAGGTGSFTSATTAAASTAVPASTVTSIITRYSPEVGAGISNCNADTPVLAPGMTIVQSLQGATTFAGAAPCLGLTRSNEVWYQFQPVAAARVDLSTCNAQTTLDTVIHVFSGACGALQCVVSNDDTAEPCLATGSNHQAAVSFCAEPQTYFVAVHAFGGRVDGRFALTVTASHSCTKKRSLPNNSTLFVNVSDETLDYNPFAVVAHKQKRSVAAVQVHAACANAIDVRAGGLGVAPDNIFVRQDVLRPRGGAAPMFTPAPVEMPCYGAQPRLVHYYRVLGAGQMVHATTCTDAYQGTSFDTVITVFAATQACLQPSCVRVNDDARGFCALGQSSVNFCARNNINYFVAVSGADNEVGAPAEGVYALEISEGGACPATTGTVCCIADALVPAAVVPVFDTRIFPQTVLPLGEFSDRERAILTQEPRTLAGRWFLIDIDAGTAGTQHTKVGAQYVASTCNIGTTIDTQIVAFTGSCSNLVVLGRNDDIDAFSTGTAAHCALNSAASTLRFCGTGTAVWLFVSGVDVDEEGPIQLTFIEEGPCALCVPDCTGATCGSDGCGGSCGTCRIGACRNSECVCIPHCTDSICGSDGCGGTCGTCNVGDQCIAGQCEFVQTNLACTSAYVLPYDTEIRGSTVNTPYVAQPACFGAADAEGRAVWYSLAGKNGTITVSTCFGRTDADTVITVFTGVCTGLGCAKVNDESATPCVASLTATAASTVAFDGVTATTYYIRVTTADAHAGGDFIIKATTPCQPNCDGKNCGNDGCGGSCGNCTAAGQACTITGVCSVCQPNCGGRECGDDGCGGTCGTCADELKETCDTSGLCVACRPNCVNKDCGDDGCGSVCGACIDGQQCSPKQVCVSCLPQCTNKNCGADGCGGVCGTCNATNSEVCVESLCSAGAVIVTVNKVEVDLVFAQRRRALSASEQLRREIATLINIPVSAVGIVTYSATGARVVLYDSPGKTAQQAAAELLVAIQTNNPALGPLLKKASVQPVVLAAPAPINPAANNANQPNRRVGQNGVPQNLGQFGQLSTITLPSDQTGSAEFSIRSLPVVQVSEPPLPPRRRQSSDANVAQASFIMVALTVIAALMC